MNADGPPLAGRLRFRVDECVSDHAKVAAMTDGPRDGNVQLRPFHVVFICTGNRARSALAEASLRAKTASVAVRVESYGTLRLGGRLGPETALPEAIAAGASLGLDLQGHRARSLDGVRLDEADLVIGFESFHIAAAVVDAGAPRERSFLLRELVELFKALPRIDGASDLARARVVVAHADELRGGKSGSALSLADPYGESKQVFEEVAATIDSLTSVVVRRLFGAPRSEHTLGPGAA